MTARQHRRIEKTSLIRFWLSTAFQATVSALVISAGLRGGFAWPLTVRPRCSQRCSIGLRFGELVGHGSITPTLFASRKARVTHAACGGALSCWNMRPWAGNALKKGSTCGVKMSLMYLSAFMLALTTTSWLFPCRLIAPQIITERLSLTVVMHPGANLSPLRRQTLLRPSCRSMGYGDSSEKITRIHPLLHCPPDISPSKVEPGDLVPRGQELLLAGSAVLDTMDLKASSYGETADLIVTSPISWYFRRRFKSVFQMCRYVCLQRHLFSGVCPTAACH